MQGVRKDGWSLGFYKSKREIERLLLQGVHGVKDLNNQRLFESFHKECMQGPFWRP
jgi:hypothetical protein